MAMQGNGAGKTPPAAEIRSFRDLEVWREGMELADACHGLTRSFPDDERDGLVKEIRAAAGAVPAAIARGFSQEREVFLGALRVAQGRLAALQTYLILALDLSMAPAATIEPVRAQAERLAEMIRTLYRSLQDQ